MVAIVGITFPLRCHLGRLGSERFPFRLRSTSQTQDLTESRHAEDRLQGQVGIVPPVSGKVVGTELRFRVLSIFDKIVGPSAQQTDVGLIEPFRIALYAAYSRCEDEQVAALLDRHIPSESSVGIRSCDAVSLSVGMRISAQVVGSEVGESPPQGILAVVEHRAHHRLLQIRVVTKEERSLGIRQVDGVDTTV